MKKIIVFIFAFLLLFNFRSTGFAQDSMMEEEKQATDAAEISPTPTPDYQLPYPGLLPDNPLYFLKTFRDKLIDFLVSDPLKKAELNLLQADKRLSTGIALIDKGKADLAEQTISKGANYFEEAIVKTKAAEKQGMDTLPILEKLQAAAIKHREMLLEMEKKTTGDVKKKFRNLSTRMANLEKEVKKISDK